MGWDNRDSVVWNVWFVIGHRLQYSNNIEPLDFANHKFPAMHGQQTFGQKWKPLCTVGPLLINPASQDTGTSLNWAADSR